MHWRRFAVKDIPVQDHEAFGEWVTERWREKDELLETFYNTGRFPGDDTTNKQGEYIETDVRLQSRLEIGQIFIVLAAFAMVANVLVKLWEMLRGTRH